MKSYALGPIFTDADRNYDCSMAEVTDLVCIVDDDPSVRRALGRVVRSFGFDVQLLSTARECLDGPYIDRASCLIADVTMPDMDGFELHSLLEASDRHVPTVFISGNNDLKNADRSRSAGGVAFLDKPCDAELLHDAILKAIKA